jgi:hypothetical protein
MKSPIFILALYLATLSQAKADAGTAPTACTEKWANDVRKNLDSVRTLHLKFRPDIVPVQSKTLNDAIQGVQKICAEFAMAKSQAASSQSIAKSANIQQCEGLVMAAKGYGSAWDIYSNLFSEAWGANRRQYDLAYSLQQWNDKEIYPKQAEIDQAAKAAGTGQRLRAEIKKIYDLAQLKLQTKSKGPGTGLVRNHFFKDSAANTPFKQTQAAYQELEDYFFGKSREMEAAYTTILTTVQGSGSLCSPAQYNEVQSIYERMNPKGLNDPTE